MTPAEDGSAEDAAVPRQDGADPDVGPVVARALELADQALRAEQAAAEELAALAEGSAMAHAARQHLADAAHASPRAAQATRLLDQAIDDHVDSSSSADLLHRIGRAIGVDDDLPIDPDLDTADTAEPSRTHRPSGTRVHRGHPGVLAAVAAGGFIGTLGRYEVATAWPAGAGHFPAAIFVINTSGAFLIGLLVTVIAERIRPTRFLRPFAVTGVLGGWTTMSTFAVGVDSLVRSGDVATAGGYLAATLVAGVTGVTVGIALGRYRPGMGGRSRAIDEDGQP